MARHVQLEDQDGRLVAEHGAQGGIRIGSLPDDVEALLDLEEEPEAGRSATTLPESLDAVLPVL
jgi:ribosomal 30S subunit maturation factor RimM